jgi:hypothetical protein
VRGRLRIRLFPRVGCLIEHRLVVAQVTWNLEEAKRRTRKKHRTPRKAR